MDVENRLRSTVSGMLILDEEGKFMEETKRTLNLGEITGPEFRSVVLGGGCEWVNTGANHRVKKADIRDVSFVAWSTCPAF